MEAQHTRRHKFAEWVAQSSKVRAEHGIPKHDKPWSQRRGIQMSGVPARPRVVDLLDVGFALRQRALGHYATSAELRRSYYCDISGSVERKPFAVHPFVFRRNSFLYSYETDSVLSGAAQLEVMGWPRRLLPSASVISDSEYRDLSGECYSVPIAAVLNMCFYCNPWGPWWHGA